MTLDEFKQEFQKLKSGGFIKSLRTGAIRIACKKTF